jgi:hypothetical protein
MQCFVFQRDLRHQLARADRSAGRTLPCREHSASVTQMARASLFAGMLAREQLCGKA